MVYCEALTRSEQHFNLPGVYTDSTRKTHLETICQNRPWWICR